MQRCKQVRAASCASVFDGSSKCSLLAKSRARAPRAAAAGALTAARAADAAHMNATLDTSGPSGAGPASRTALARLSIPGCIVRGESVADTLYMYSGRGYLTTSRRTPPVK